MIRTVLLSSAVLISFGTLNAQRDASKAGLTKQQRLDILRVTGNQSDDANDPDKLVMPSVELLRLSVGRGRSRELVASAEFGGGSANASHYVFRLTANRALLILGDAEGSMFGRLRSVHHGMYDFITFYNLGGGEGTSQVFEFDGSRYRSAYCYDTTLARDTEPERHGPHHPCNTQRLF